MSETPIYDSVAHFHGFKQHKEHPMTLVKLERGIPADFRPHPVSTPTFTEVVLQTPRETHDTIAKARAEVAAFEDTLTRAEFLRVLDSLEESGL